jgi:glyoxylase-like metal-dependent hydrolase (beta-lactamase superfamily II)
MISGVATNCYFLTNADTLGTIVVDPGGQPDRILSHIEAVGLKPVAILLTHGHFDHIMAVNELKAEFGIPVYAGIDEKNLLNDGNANLSAMYTDEYVTEADTYLSDGDEVELAGIRIKVMSTPGHTGGSVCYLVEGDGVLISGDTLFYGSVGRTDFPTGSDVAMKKSIRERLALLPDETVVYPGHGRATTIGIERQSNSWF